MIATIENYAVYTSTLQKIMRSKICVVMLYIA